MATAVQNYPFCGSNSSRRTRSTSVLGILEAEIEDEIAESRSRSQYMRRMDDLISLAQQVSSLCQVQPNWDSYGAEAPQSQAIRAAMKFLPLAAEADILPTRSL